MKASHRALYVLLAMLLFLGGAPLVARAGNNTPLVINADVAVTANVPGSEAPYALLVQATARTKPDARYVLTVVNLSPWPMSSLRILDRYYSIRPDGGAEVHHEWLPRRLAPGEATAYVMRYADGFVAGGCHQLEIAIADGLGTVLIDCSQPDATTLWNVPLTDAMASYLAEPALTLDEPAGSSKLGLHVTANNSPKIMEFIRTAKPAVVVAVGGVGWLKDVKAASPNTVTVGRLLEGDQSFVGDPAVRARDYVQAHASEYLLNGGVDYWLGWNEPTVDRPWQMSWYAAFEAERTLAMAELGLRVAVGNFAVGNPEADEFSAFMPAIAAAQAYDGVLAVHEYSAPTLRDGLGMGIPGLASDADSGALTLRYRYWYDHYLQPNNLVVPLIVTEAGIDGGVLAGNEAGLGGWRDFYGGEPAEVGAEYVQQLSWYDDELRRDPYVLGFAIFNAGDLSGKWESFEVTALLPQLAEVVAGKP
jgi:hypothetical protein